MKQHELIGDIQLMENWGISWEQFQDTPDYVIGCMKEYHECERKGSERKAKKDEMRMKLKNKMKKR